MKKIGAMILLAGLFASCGNGATDGDPKTDTTAMPPDSNINKDTVSHVNRNYGVGTDTSSRDSAGSRRQ